MSSDTYINNTYINKLFTELTDAVAAAMSPRCLWDWD